MCYDRHHLVTVNVYLDFPRIDNKNRVVIFFAGLKQVFALDIFSRCEIGLLFQNHLGTIALAYSVLFLDGQHQAQFRGSQHMHGRLTTNRSGSNLLGRQEGTFSEKVPLATFGP
eukprot:scaffold10723_cov164-Amphora_coffeaeformis.AAC.10